MLVINNGSTVINVILLAREVMETAWYLSLSIGLCYFVAKDLLKWARWLKTIDEEIK